MFPVCYDVGVSVADVEIVTDSFHEVLFAEDVNAGANGRPIGTRS